MKEEAGALSGRGVGAVDSSGCQRLDRDPSHSSGCLLQDPDLQGCSGCRLRDPDQVDCSGCRLLDPDSFQLNPNQPALGKL